MRIAIVEDRPEDQESLRALLSEEAHARGWTYMVETYPSGEAFLSAASTFDIVFWDVMMDGIDGMETARRFHDKGGSALVVFVTVVADFAIEGYEVDAVAFLVKPVSTSQFHRVLNRLGRKLKEDVLLTLSPDVKISAGTVLYAAADHCLKIHTAEKPYFPALSKDELCAHLPNDGRFIECSRGMLVNLDHVTKVDAKTVTMDDGTHLPVSRRKRQALVNAIATRKFDSARGNMS